MRFSFEDGHAIQVSPLSDIRCAMDQTDTNRRTGFSLVEMLVVIAIIGLLLAISLPAAQQMRQSARNTECKNKLKQIAVALQSSQSQLGYLPQDGSNGWGYTVFLLPFVEQANLYEQIKPGQNSNQGVHPGVTDVELPPFLCPSFSNAPKLASQLGRLNYVGNAGLLSTKGAQLTDVTDGESMTLAAGETTADWAWANPATAKSASPPNQGGIFGSQHGLGANFVMCDGAVKWISNSVDSNVMNALFTISGNDTVGVF